MRHLIRLVPGCVLILLVSTGCFLRSDSPDDALTRFASALARKDAAGAAGQTRDPAAAQAAITSMFEGMGASARLSVAPKIIDDKHVTGTLDHRWDLGGGRTVAYQSTVQMREADSGWRVDWSPTVLHPQLRGGDTFVFSDDKSYRTPVVDRHGSPLMTWQTVHVVDLDDAHRANGDRLASVLRLVDPSVTGGEPIRLRDRDFRKVEASLRAIPGVAITEQGALLTATRALRSPAFGDLEKTWRTAVDATAGWSVSLVDADGTPTDVLEQRSPAPTAPIRTTIDRDIQVSAQRAVDGSRRAAAIVAIEPSSGGIVAVAQNRAADAIGPIGLTGMYPPGSTFKTVTTSAALDARIVSADSPVSCPGTATIEGRTIPNEDSFDLGTVPLTTAFAHSCNTTMGALANRLPAESLPAAARAMGIGVDYVIPGLTTVTGQVPPATSPALRVENGIGQGTITASPFGLAVAEASLAGGRTASPSLLTGRRTTMDSPVVTLSPATVRDIRSMMRHTVTGGTATELRSVPGLGGKTGTAEYGDNSRSHGWFAGIVGDLAFATLVVDGGSSDAAISVTGEFLRPLSLG